MTQTSDSVSEAPELLTRAEIAKLPRIIKARTAKRMALRYNNHFKCSEEWWWIIGRIMKKGRESRMEQLRVPDAEAERLLRIQADLVAAMGVDEDDRIQQSQALREMAHWCHDVPFKHSFRASHFQHAIDVTAAENVYRYVIHRGRHLLGLEPNRRPAMDRYRKPPKKWTEEGFAPVYYRMPWED